MGIRGTRIRRTLVRSAGVGVALGSFVACGSRTGLFVPDEEIFVDASIDVATRLDASFDAPFIDDRVDIPDVIEEPPGCIPGTFDLTPATSQIMFVLDRSRSMRFRLDSNVLADPGVTSRWTALRDALNQVISPFSNQIAMGARFFPVVGADGTSAEACAQDPAGAAIAPALNNAATILQVFNDTVPIGGTPTAAALRLAADQTSQRRAVARAIVVATDGAPNCNPANDPVTCVCTSLDPPLPPGQPCRASSVPNDPDGSNCLDESNTVKVVQDTYANRKIPVFVVGIGVTNTFASTLNAMAVAGGRPRATTPRYYPAETPAELTTAFTVVRDSVAKCSYVTPSAPNDPNAIDISVNGRTIPRDPSHLDGWDWIDHEYGQLQLFGSACALATATNVDGTVVCEKPDAAVSTDF